MAQALGATTRSPLAEAPYRINSNANYVDQQYAQKPRYGQIDPVHTQHEASVVHYPSRQMVTQNGSHYSRASADVRRPQTIEEDKRLSQASYASNSSRGSRKSYKTHVGPWQLGKTLGKGSSACVRLCRHTGTNQLAAVKIVNRRMAYLVQDSSLAALSKWDSSLPDQIDGQMRVPMAIEREVAILKLIEHPNIMKLYDIWENRSEIYLILEYIDQGDLFTFINSKGRLSEEVAIYFFRQIISAIAYCHSFNVCHRDLKPENILITADLQIKIADFGMAALHQTATHQLATACGSPHYAAPELLKNRQYRGDRADIWSMGVILYAMLSATLPFDDPDLRVMMNRTKKGQYEMPKFLSQEAEDLIRRMLQVNPDRRITLNEIWQHPIVQKYSYLDDFGDLTGQLPETRNGFRYTPIPRQDIDPQLLRQLRSMWHMFTEQELALKLSCDEPNDQKAFYWLLHNYREKQLEDFKPELSHSMSDYHHLKPSAWKKRISTCEFAQPRVNGHGRSISRFTVISNVAEGDTATMRSYDPYRASGRLKPTDSQISQAKIVVHRDDLASGPTASCTRLRCGSTTQRPRANSGRASVLSRAQSSRGSITSLRSTRQGTPHGRATPSLRHKRAVDFSHIRKKSSSMGGLQQPTHRNASSNTVSNGSSHRLQRVRSKTPDVPKIPDNMSAKVQGGPFAKNASALFREELRHFSNDIAKNCDDAFRSPLIVEEPTPIDTERGERGTTPLSFNLDSHSVTSDATDLSRKPWNHRPLPPLPPDGGPVSTATGLGSSRQSSGDYTDQIQRLVVPLPDPRQADRRVVSAPAYGQAGKSPALPPITENAGGGNVTIDKSRIVSAPPQATSRKANELNGSMEYLSKVETTIRVVNSPGHRSKESEPLHVRRKLTKEDLGRKLHLQIAYNAEKADEPTSATSEPLSAGMKKKRSWFRRSSRAETEHSPSNDVHSQKSPALPPQAQEPESATVDDANKRRTFSFPFWKSNRSHDTNIMAEGEADSDTQQQQVTKVGNGDRKVSTSGLQDSTSGDQRNIEVKQNWLTRLFRVKPATSYICMTLSRRRARQEVAILLREWRRYGIRDIQVDKQRNIIFARVGARNYLNIKEVAIAAEVVTVIEHGKRQQLSIVRFTQERGAATSFHRVVDTMRLVFDSRGLVVGDRRKQKMMIKTLTAASAS